MLQLRFVVKSLNRGVRAGNAALHIINDGPGGSEFDYNSLDELTTVVYMRK